MSIRADLLDRLTDALGPDYHVHRPGTIPDFVRRPTIVLFLTGITPTAIRSGRVEASYALWMLTPSDEVDGLEDRCEAIAWDVLMRCAPDIPATWGEFERDVLGSRYHGFRATLTITTTKETP